MKSQREAVYAATIAVLSNHGIEFEDGMDVSELVSKDMKQEIYAILCEGFRQGEIVLADTASNKTKLSNPSEMTKYVNGLVNNWFRKDTRFNGGTKYVAKNPGSRAGQGDEQLKALKILKSKFANDPTKAATIQQHIDARVAEIQAKKAESVTVDISALPSDLVAALGLKK